MRFSVVTVTYNSGTKLLETCRNILSQTFGNFELLVKDGGSTDDSLTILQNNISDDRLRIVSAADKGIYDGMNEAVKAAGGDYVIFMNCGDSFSTVNVLAEAAAFIDGHPGEIYYGDVRYAVNDTVFHMPSSLGTKDYYCHIPCHQACIFARGLFENGGFDLKYKIRGDYEFFLRAHYGLGVEPIYLGMTVADYEGGGYSESKKNIAIDKKEQREIAEKYMGRKTVRKYRLQMILTLQPLRKKLAESRLFGKSYDSLKKNLRK